MDVREAICEVGRILYEKEYVAANDGNITVLLEDGTVWATPAGVSKGSMTTDMLVRVDREGNVLEGTRKVSSQIYMHLRVYNERPDVRSVVHAHPITATGFAVAGVPLDKNTLPEQIIYMGAVPIVEYGTPSTDEIPDALSNYLQHYDAFLLENHGLLTVGESLQNAYYKMERIENCARVSLVARLLGGEQELPDFQIAKLLDVRKKFGAKGKHPLIDK